MTTEKTMTMREFLTNVANGNLTPETTDFASAQLDKLDAKNSSRASKQAEKSAAEYAPLIEQVTALLTENPDGLMISQIAEMMGIHSSKVSAIIKKMGEAVKTEKVKVPKAGERVKVHLA